jgi:hypothetical protein
MFRWPVIDALWGEARDRLTVNPWGVHHVQK